MPGRVGPYAVAQGAFQALRTIGLAPTFASPQAAHSWGPFSLARGFCPVGSTLVQGCDLPLGAGTLWIPQWIAGEGRAFHSELCGPFRLHMGTGQPIHATRAGTAMGSCGPVLGRDTRVS